MEPNSYVVMDDDTPLVGNRQQIRRHLRKRHKAAVARAERAEQKAVLERLREARAPWSLPKKAPGLLTMLGRPFKKPRGKDKPGWRTRQLTAIDGFPIPEGLDVTFHTTKGLRAVRLPR